MSCTRCRDIPERMRVGKPSWPWTCPECWTTFRPDGTVEEDERVAGLRAQLAVQTARAEEAESKLGLKLMAFRTIGKLEKERDAALARETVLRDLLDGLLRDYDACERTHEVAYYCFLKGQDAFWERARTALSQPSEAVEAFRDRVRREALEEAAKVVDDLDMPDMWDGSIGRTDDGGAFRRDAVSAIRALADKEGGK